MKRDEAEKRYRRDWLLYINIPVPEPKTQLNYPAGMSVVCFINLTFPELILLLCGSLFITAKLDMLIVCFLDAVANHCLFFKQVSGPKVPLEGGMYNFIGRVGGWGEDYGEKRNETSFWNSSQM